MYQQGFVCIMSAYQEFDSKQRALWFEGVASQRFHTFTLRVVLIIYLDCLLLHTGLPGCSWYTLALCADSPCSFLTQLMAAATSVEARGADYAFTRVISSDVPYYTVLRRPLPPP